MANLKYFYLTILLFLLYVVYSSAKPTTRKLDRSSLEGLMENTNSSFSEWSAWTKCNRQCQQFRRRICLKPDECENKTQKFFRACHSSKCHNKLLVMENTGGSKKRPSRSRILLHLQQHLYSAWSQWSPCSISCHTRRTRSCKRPEICGKKVHEDYRNCYHEGDICEKVYSDSMNRLPGFIFTTPSPEAEKAHPLYNIKCGTSEVPPLDLRIVGGRYAVKDAWPWQVLILTREWIPYCGGSLLNDEWVLTAAHCVREKMRVRAGEYDLSEIEGTEQEEMVEKAIVHPAYEQGTGDYDIAVLKLKKPFQLNRHAQPICLPKPEDELHLYARATVAGWGKRRDKSNYGTDILHMADVPVVPPEECQDSYDDEYISDNMLCAGFDRGRVDTCSGDSGGPLMYNISGRWTAFGVTSFGDGCGRRGKFGVYVNLPNAVNWIKHIIALVSGTTLK